MEIDLERCKELDKLHDYKYDPIRVKKLGGFHASCAIKFKMGMPSKSIARFAESRQFHVSEALYNLGFIAKPIKKIPWKLEDIRRLEELTNEKKPIGFIMCDLGRSRESVLQKMKSIKREYEPINVHIKPRPKHKKCQCGETIISFNDQCNWCWGKNEAA